MSRERCDVVEAPRHRGERPGRRHTQRLQAHPRRGRRRRADAIVMAADPPQHWLISNMVWSQDPYRVRRLAPVPVYLVIEKEHID